MRYIGQIQSPHLEALVRAEINRVLQNYIAVQNAEVLRDSQVDVKNRFTTSDVVRRVTGLVTNMHLDRIDVALALETLSREVVKIKKQVTL
jgi:dsDNA-specific endonuclease/ATPase MutS2